jgi:hypothetical protein
MEKPLKQFFISQGTPACENIYRRIVDTGERNSFPTKLFSRKTFS